jgi:hypothetical protein
MNFLNRIDFNDHDGVNRSMINDFMRNQFYDNILKDNVKDQHCIDIGFGTGLLSLLAIKHGAKSIIAYESDDDRYELGCHVIKKLGLEHQITLLHSRFNFKMLDQYPTVTVAFSETVNGNLWQEGLLNSLPRQHKINFLPGQYFLEIYACIVPDSFAQGLIYPTADVGFAPGVDIDGNFIKLINDIGFPGKGVPATMWSNSQTQFLNFEVHNETNWGWMPYLRLCVNNGKLVSGYYVDANNITNSVVNNIVKPIEFNCQEQQLIIDTTTWGDSSVILIPRAGMMHGEHRLMLDTGHWGPTLDPVILNRPTSNIVITHNFHNGLITYTNVKNQPE